MDRRPIFINGRFLTQLITGSQRYAHEIVACLDGMVGASPSDWPEIKILVPPHSGTFPRYQHLQIIEVGKRKGRLWEQVELPFHARRGVLFTPCGGAPLLHLRNVVTIHDAGVYATPDGYSSSFGLWYRFLYRVLCHTSLQVFTVSQSSRSELIKYCGANPARVCVTYLGSEHASRPEADMRILKEYGIEPYQYVFTVSSRTPNKNIDGLLRAFQYFSGPSLDLVVAGVKNVKVFGEPSDLPSSVIDVGYVSDASLRALYKYAKCFVFPSLYEGFGLPPLEAMAAGCPTVVSERSSLAEIFGTVAFLCDPDDPRDIAEKVVQACAATAEYRERCIHLAKLFQWNRCAKTTWRMIAELCDEGEVVHSPARRLA
ncbi:MAG TPA: glycosyltransferase family 1 protein [Acidisarcina sp.]